MSTNKKNAKLLAKTLTRYSGFRAGLKKENGEYFVCFKMHAKDLSLKKILSISHYHSRLLEKNPEFRDIQVRIE